MQHASRCQIIFLLRKGACKNEKIKMIKCTCDPLIRSKPSFVMRAWRSFSNFTENLFRPTVPNGPSVTSHKLRMHSSVDRAWLKPCFESVNGFQEQTLERCLPSCLDNIGRPSPPLGCRLGTRMRLYSALQPHEITHKRI